MAKIFYLISFVDRLKSLQYETVTTTEEMVNEEQIRKEIEQQYKIRLVLLE